MERILILVICIVELCLFIQAQDETVYAKVSTSARLACDSSVLPLEVAWFETEDLVNLDNRIVLHLPSSNNVFQGIAYDGDKHDYNDSDYSLTLKHVQYNDEMKYSCLVSSSFRNETTLIQLIVLVPPSQPVLTQLTFQENTPTSTQCRVSSVKPGVGSVVSIVTVDLDFIFQSSDSDLLEGSTDPITGAVSVTYSPQISLQRKRNGKQAVCEVVWREGEETMISEGKTVNVIFSATSITITQSPSGLIPENTPITFTCLTDEANPTASVTWTVHDSSRSSTSDSTVDDGVYSAVKRQSVLILTAEKGLHDKQVNCVVSDNTGVASETTLNIAYVGTKDDFPFTLSPDTSNPVPVGTSVTFTCSLDANPIPSYSIWTNDGQSQWVDLDKNKNSITLTLKKQHNKVNLFCRADGSLPGYPVTSALKSYTVEFSASSITMTQSPSGPVSEDTEVTFTCVTDEAEPTANVVWTVGGNSVSSTSDTTEEGMYNTETRRSVLEVTVDRTLNGKEVVCYVSGRSASRDTVTLDVRFPHNAAVIPYPSDSVLEGSSLTLTCEATGGNPPEVLTYSWSFVPRYEESSELSGNTDRVLQFDSVEYSQAGVYRCAVTNGAGVNSGSKELFVQCVPQAPHPLMIYSVTAISMTVSWLGGRNAGSLQTFTITYQKESVSESKTITDIADPGAGIRVNYTITGLKPETDYFIKIMATNIYGDSAQSPSVSNKTLDLPLVLGDLVAKVSDKDITFRWESLEGTFTRAVIFKCTSDCTVIHEVTDLQATSAKVSGVHSEGTEYKLVFYQGDVLVNEKYFAIIASPNEEGNSLVATIVSVVIVVIVLTVVIVVAVWFFKRQQKIKNDRKPAAENEESTHTPVYRNVFNASADSHYEGLDKNDVQENPPQYEDLNVINTSAGLTLNEIVIYENINKSRHTAVHDDIDLTVENIISKGRYSLLKSGMLKTHGKQISVMVKSSHADIGVSETQFLLNQVTCLEQIGSHSGIVESYAFGITDLMSVKVVTKYYKNGNLRKFLQQRSKREDWLHTQNKNSFLEKLVVHTLHGLVYLESQSHVILHLQLSAEHVLVDDAELCRLTGFGFKEHVLQREITEEDEGIYGAIEWKAPEVIEDCRAHSRASDVWAFGILLYEIYTLGGVPYDGMSDEDIKAYIKNANAPKKPNDCPVNIYELMNTCWAYNPDQRPSFSSLLHKLEALNKPAYGAVITAEKPTYENVVKIPN